MADGQEGILALQEVLERTVDAARGLLERAEVSAAEAEEGEVSSHICAIRTVAFGSCPFFALFVHASRTGNRCE